MFIICIKVFSVYVHVMGKENQLLLVSTVMLLNVTAGAVHSAELFSSMFGALI